MTGNGGGPDSSSRRPRGDVRRTRGAREDEFIESGSFRIDRRKALKKLMGFQLAEPERFLLSWIRLAAAGGAEKISLMPLTKGLELRFDGAPLPKSALRDPYRVFFDSEAARPPRLSHLAVGMLGAWRLEPAMIHIRSGKAPRRFRLKAASLTEQSLDELREKDRDTVMRVWWKSGCPQASLFRLVRTCCRLSPSRLTTRGKLVRTGPPPGALPFEIEGARGWLELPDQPRGAVSELRLHVFGSWVCTHEHTAPWVQLGASINDDLLKLDASHSGVVQNARLTRLRKAVEARAEDLILAKLEEQERRMPETARLLLDADIRPYWSADASRHPGLTSRIEETLKSLVRGLATAGTSKRFRAKVRTLQIDAKRTRWLRGACRAKLLTPARIRRRPIYGRLWNAPLFLDRDCSPVSLAAIRDRADRDRCVLFHEHPRALGPARDDSPKAVWALWREEQEDLQALFPDTRIRRLA